MSGLRERDLKELAALQMRICAKLNETLGLSQELAEAVERQDQVSVKLLLSSRQKPILELQELYAAIKLKRCDLSGGDEEDFDRLVSGGAAETEEERPVAAQQAANQRLLERLIGLDRRLNEMLCKERSIYKTGRQARAKVKNKKTSAAERPFLGSASAAENVCHLELENCLTVICQAKGTTAARRWSGWQTARPKSVGHPTGTSSARGCWDPLPGCCRREWSPAGE